MTSTLERPPVLFLSHGAPPLADDATWTRELNEWSGTFDKPTDILMVSAHWENAPVTLSATGPAGAQARPPWQAAPGHGNRERAAR